jgi:hypothetical protein
MTQSGNFWIHTRICQVFVLYFRSNLFAFKTFSTITSKSHQTLKGQMRRLRSSGTGSPKVVTHNTRDNSKYNAEIAQVIRSLDEGTTEFQFPPGEGTFFSPPPISWPIGREMLSLAAKPSVREADHSPQSSPEVENALVLYLHGPTHDA